MDKIFLRDLIMMTVIAILIIVLSWLFFGCSASDRIGGTREQPQPDSVTVMYMITSMQSEVPVRGIVTFNGVTEPTVILPFGQGKRLAIGSYAELRFNCITQDVFTNGYYYLPEYGNKMMGEPQKGNSGSFSMIREVKIP